MPRHEENPGQSENKARESTRALELRIAGHSYRKIAEMLGVSHQTAHNWVTGELDKIAAENREKAEQLQTMELERIDDALEKITTGEAYRSGDPQTINTFIRLSESRRKLLGMDAPTKTDVTSGGAPIVFDVRLPGTEDTDDGNG